MLLRGVKDKERAMSGKGEWIFRNASIDGGKLPLRVNS